MRLDPLPEKFAAFGWHGVRVNGNDISAVLNLGPGDLVPDITPNLEVVARNGQAATRSQTVTMKLPKGYSGNDFYIRIGAGYGPLAFVYHYRVLR